MSDKTKSMVLMLLKELRYYYGEFNFELFNSDKKELISLMKSEGFDSSKIQESEALSIGEVCLFVGELESIKSENGW